MRVRFKAKALKGMLDTEKNKEKKEKMSKKTKSSPVLVMQLRHGDVVTMCDNHLQVVTEVSSIPQAFPPLF